MKTIWKWMVEIYMTSMYGRWEAVRLFSHWKDLGHNGFGLASIKQEGMPVEYDPAAVYSYYAMHRGTGAAILCNDAVEATRIAAYRNGLRGQ